MTEIRPKIHSLTMADGRQLMCTETGHPEGYPIIVGHGMPGCGYEGLLFHEEAAAAGFRILTPDRPGLRQSTYQANRKLLDYPDDIRSVADQLGADEFIHMGWSSGGSRTLACAYGLPERTRLAVVLSGYTNFAELPHARAMLLKTLWPGPVIADLSPRLFRWLVRLMVAVSKRRPDTYMATAKRLFSDHDHQIFEEQEQMQRFRQDQISCLNSGHRAIATDLWTELVDWGFRLREVKVPTLIYQGEKDLLVPLKYCHHMAGEIPEADLTLLPHSGHFYPMDREFQKSLFSRLKRIIG